MGKGMIILAALVAWPLVTQAAVDRQSLAPPAMDAKAMQSLPPRQKDALMRPLIRSANECVVHAVVADPRYQRNLSGEAMGELIVNSMTVCTHAMQTMIGMHDRLFGSGSGETFFMGPYLDVLPAAVSSMVDRGE